MEVKIKQGKEMIDATIEMVDGVMVVSPVVKFEPKDGDVIAVYYQEGNWIIAIFENYYKHSFNASAVLHNDGTIGICCGSVEFGNINRYATEEEKKLLFDRLAEEGYSWDAERKELVELKWKPSVGQHFYYVEYDNESFAFIAKAYTYAFEDQIERDKTIAKGWCFKTSNECQEFCDRLNDAISQVKP